MSSFRIQAQRAMRRLQQAEELRMQWIEESRQRADALESDSNGYGQARRKKRRRRKAPSPALAMA